MKKQKHPEQAFKPHKMSQGQKQNNTEGFYLG